MLVEEARKAMTPPEGFEFFGEGGTPDHWGTIVGFRSESKAVTAMLNPGGHLIGFDVHCLASEGRSGGWTCCHLGDRPATCDGSSLRAAEFDRTWGRDWAALSQELARWIGVTP